MKRHPLSVVWGDMPPDQFQELVEDVQKHGVREPIVCHDELILDGWHRFRAAAKAEKTCKFIPLPEGEDPAHFVIAKNLHRRHLTTGQRAMIAVEIANLARGGDRRSGKFQNARLRFESVTRADAARKMGVSRRSANTASTIREQADPETVMAVKSGEKSLHAAARKAKGKTGSASSNKTKTLPPASAAKLQAKVEQLENALTAARMEIEEKAAKIDELEERIAFIQAESSPVAAVREEKFNNYRAHIRTLKGSVGQWQTKFQESNAENRFLRKRLRALGENIRP